MYRENYFGKRKRISKQEKIEIAIANLPIKNRYKDILVDGVPTPTLKSYDELVKQYTTEYEKYGRKSYVNKIYRETKNVVGMLGEESVNKIKYVTELNYTSKSDKGFLEIYGKEKVKYNGENRSIKYFINKFINGQLSQKQMNKILKTFKDTSEKYKSAGSP